MIHRSEFKDIEIKAASVIVLKHANFDVASTAPVSSNALLVADPHVIIGIEPRSLR